MAGPSKIRTTEGDRKRAQARTNKELYSLLRRQSGPNFNIAGSSLAIQQATGDDNRFLKVSGDTMIGPIAFLPKLVEIATDEIDIGRDSGNFSSNVIINAEGAPTTDDLVTITGAAHAGQLLILEGTVGETITIKNTGNIVTLTGSDWDLPGNDSIIFKFQSTTNKWQQITAGNASLGDNLGNHIATQDILPSTDATHDIGASGNQFATVWTNNIQSLVTTAVSAPTFSITSANTFIGDEPTDELTIQASLNGDIIPTTDATASDLGSSSKRFQNLYVGVVQNPSAVSIVSPFTSITGSTLNIGDESTDVVELYSGQIRWNNPMSDVDIPTAPSGSRTLFVSKDSGGHISVKNDVGGVIDLEDKVNSLDDLADVTITGPTANEQILMNTGTQWVNTDPASANIYANKLLSNLRTDVQTAVNIDILPDANDTWTLGEPGFAWKEIHVSEKLKFDENGALAAHPTGTDNWAIYRTTNGEMNFSTGGNAGVFNGWSFRDRDGLQRMHFDADGAAQQIDFDFWPKGIHLRKNASDTDSIQFYPPGNAFDALDAVINSNETSAAGYLSLFRQGVRKVDIKGTEIAFSNINTFTPNADIAMGGNQVQNTGNIFPITSDTYDIGQSTDEYANLYVNNVVASASVGNGAGSAISWTTGINHQVTDADNFTWTIGAGGADYTFDETQFTLTNKNISTGTGYLRMLDRADPSTPTTDEGYFYVKDVAGTSKPYFIGHNQAAIDLSGATSTFNDLTDTTFTGLATDDLVQYTGTDWVNVTGIDASSIESGILGISRGGTGNSTNARGDILYAPAAATWSRLSVGAVNTVLRSDSTDPSWGTIDLAFLSDVTAKTGSGTTVVMDDSPTISNATLSGSPSITSIGWFNANHNHNDTNRGGQLVATTALTATGTKDSTTFLRGDDTWATISAGATSLTELSDVTITVAATDELLKYNGSQWVDAVLDSDDIPNLDTSKLTTGILGISRGGTGNATNARGDILYSPNAGNWSRLAVGGVNTVLKADSTDVSWGTIDLSFLSDVTAKSGTGTTVIMQGSPTITTPTLTTPTISSISWLNANHNHEDNNRGGQLNIPNASNATGTPSSTTYLRGDNTWGTPSGGATELDDLTDVSIGTPVTNTVLTYSGAAWVDVLINGSSIASNAVTVDKLAHPTTRGRIIASVGVADVPTWIEAGTSGQVLKANGTDADLSWGWPNVDNSINGFMWQETHNSTHGGTDLFQALFHNDSNQQGTLIPTAGLMYAVPFQVPQEITIRRFALMVNTADSQPDIYIGIYSNRTDGELYPQTKLCSAEAATVTGTGVYEFGISPYTLSPGMYWAVFLATGTIGSMVLEETLSTSLNVMGWDKNGSVGDGAVVGFYDTGKTSLPTTFTDGFTPWTDNGAGAPAGMPIILWQD